MGAEIIGGIIAGVGALAGGIATGVGASSAARTSTAFASQMREDDMKFATDMKLWDIDRANEVFGMENAEYDRRLANQTENQKQLLEWLQKNFNSPAAQAKALRAAGLSPSVLYGSGNNPFGSIGVPEISSPASPSVKSQGIGDTSLPSHIQPQFNNVGEGIGQGISQAANIAIGAMDTLSKKKATDVNTKHTRELFAGVLRKQQLDIQNQETKNAVDAFNKTLLEKYGDEQKAMELISLIGDAYSSFQKGDLDKFQAKKEAAMANMAERMDKLDALSKVDLQFYANNMLRQFVAETELKEQEVKIAKLRPSVMRSEARKNIAEANLADSKRATEDALRNLRKSWQQLLNEGKSDENIYNSESFQKDLEILGERVSQEKYATAIQAIAKDDAEGFSALMRILLPLSRKQKGDVRKAMGFVTSKKFRVAVGLSPDTDD